LLLTVFSTTTFISAQEEATTKEGKKVLLYNDGSWIFAETDPLYNFKAITIEKLEIPKTLTKDIIISHTGFTFSYNETYEQANWVAYELTNEETNKIVDRTDKFIPDPKVKTGTANDKDYESSGYDRGHLAPASDMGWSSTTMAESFYYSNMSPQVPSFNRGIWKRLEDIVRVWAVENNSVYIVTGPVLTHGLPTIGKNKVSVPMYFYKVILDYTEPGIKGIGFIFPNTGSSELLQNYAVTIDSVERFTAIDFFPLLPDEQETIIESTLELKLWPWNNTKSANDKVKSINSVQCNGVTKNGERCKNKTLNISGYCYLHDGQNEENSIDQSVPIKTNIRATSVQCSALTKSGSRCKRMTLSPNGRCYQHGGN
jgi:endonuclease G